MHKYEGISLSITNKINEKLNIFNKHKNDMTEKEMEYFFLKFLQYLPLTEHQVFDIYTNTDIITE